MVFSASSFLRELLTQVVANYHNSNEFEAIQPLDNVDYVMIFAKGLPQTLSWQPLRGDEERGDRPHFQCPEDSFCSLAFFCVTHWGHSSLNESTEVILNLVLCDTFFYIGESPHVINVLHELCVVLVKHSRPCAWVKFKKVRNVFVPPHLCLGRHCK